MLEIVTAGAIAGILSAPHCAVMCGPIGSYAGRKPAGLIHYQIGRALAYALTGAVAGAIGSPVVDIFWDSQVITALSWALAAVMAMAAYRSWPRAPRASPSTTALHSLRAAKPKRKRNNKVPLITHILRRFPQQPLALGAASVLLPCAALWGGLLIAASSASALGGLLAMSAFSISSGAGLMASGFLAAQLRKGRRRARALSMLFAGAALLLILRPMSVPRVAEASDSADAPASMHCPLHPEGAS